MLLALWGVFRRVPFSLPLFLLNPFAPSVVSLPSEIWNQSTALLSPGAEICGNDKRLAQMGSLSTRTLKTHIRATVWVQMENKARFITETPGRKLYDLIVFNAGATIRSVIVSVLWQLLSKHPCSLLSTEVVTDCWLDLSCDKPFCTLLWFH